MTKQLPELPERNINDVSVKIVHEKKTNSNRYIDFIDGNERESLVNGLNEYIGKKMYNTSFGYLIPVIAANAIAMNILIVDRNGCSYEVLCINCIICDRRMPAPCIMVYKNGEHYAAIVPFTPKNVSCS